MSLNVSSPMNGDGDGGMDANVLERRLELLRDTQESVQGLSLWCQANKKYSGGVIDIWLKVLRKSPVEKRLTLFYLANDVVQHMKRKNEMGVVNQWAFALQKAIPLVRSPSSVSNAITRIFKIWEERNVYSKEAVADMIALLNNSTAKEKTGQKKAEVFTATNDKVSSFQPNSFIQKIKSAYKLKSHLGVTFRTKQYASMDIERLKTSIKDRDHGSEVVKELTILLESLRVSESKLQIEVDQRKQIVEMADIGVVFYENVRGEAKIVNNAYKNFTNRVLLTKEKLEEKVQAFNDMEMPIPMIFSPDPVPIATTPTPPPVIISTETITSNKPSAPPPPIIRYDNSTDNNIDTSQSYSSQLFATSIENSTSLNDIQLPPPRSGDFNNSSSENNQQQPSDLNNSMQQINTFISPYDNWNNSAASGGVIPFSYYGATNANYQNQQQVNSIYQTQDTTPFQQAQQTSSQSLYQTPDQMPFQMPAQQQQQQQQQQQNPMSLYPTQDSNIPFHQMSNYYQTSQQSYQPQPPLPIPMLQQQYQMHQQQNYQYPPPNLPNDSSTMPPLPPSSSSELHQHQQHHDYDSRPPGVDENNMHQQQQQQHQLSQPPSSLLDMPTNQPPPPPLIPPPSLPSNDSNSNTTINDNSEYNSGYPPSASDYNNSYGDVSTSTEFSSTHHSQNNNQQQQNDSFNSYQNQQNNFQSTSPSHFNQSHQNQPTSPTTPSRYQPYHQSRGDSGPGPRPRGGGTPRHLLNQNTSNNNNNFRGRGGFNNSQRSRGGGFSSPNSIPSPRERFSTPSPIGGFLGPSKSLQQQLLELEARNPIGKSPNRFFQRHLSTASDDSSSAGVSDGKMNGGKSDGSSEDSHPQPLLSISNPGFMRPPFRGGPGRGRGGFRGGFPPRGMRGGRGRGGPRF